MHLLGDIQKRHRKGRTAAEKIFKAVNSLIIAVQFAGLIITGTYACILSTKTFTHNMFYPGKVELSSLLTYKLQNCTQPIVYNFEAVGDFNLVLDSNLVLEFLAQHSYYATLAIFFTLLSVVVGALNKVIFDMNIYSVRYRNLVFRKSTVTAIEFVLIAIGLTNCILATYDAPMLQDYFQHCGIRTRNLLPYASPLTGLFVAHSVVMFGHLVTFIILIKNGMAKPPKPPQYYPVDFMVITFQEEVIFSPSTEDMEGMLDRNPDRRQNTAVDRSAFENDLPINLKKKKKKVKEELPPVKVPQRGDPLRLAQSSYVPPARTAGRPANAFPNAQFGHTSLRHSSVRNNNGFDPAASRSNAAVQLWRDDALVQSGGGVAPLEPSRLVQTQNSYYGGTFNQDAPYASPGSSVGRINSNGSSQSLRQDFDHHRDQERMAVGLFN